MTYDFVIVGGGAAGPRVGTVLRRRLPKASIVLFQAEELLSYARCGLPYYASGDIESMDQLVKMPYGTTRDREFFEKSRGVDVRTGCEVLAINREAKSITVRDISRGESFECVNLRKFGLSASSPDQF